MAGGTEMLQGTDIRVAGESAIFGVWEAKRGLFPLGGSACRLPRQIPYTLAMDILLTCRPITALEAQQMGLIGRVAPDGHALTVARAVADMVAANAPLSTQAILRAWRETEHMSDSDAMQHQDPIGWEVFASEDAQEGPRAFAENAHRTTTADERGRAGLPRSRAVRDARAVASRKRCGAPSTS